MSKKLFVMMLSLLVGCGTAYSMANTPVNTTLPFTFRWSEKRFYTERFTLHMHDSVRLELGVGLAAGSADTCSRCYDVRLVYVDTSEGTDVSDVVGSYMVELASASLAVPTPEQIDAGTSPDIHYPWRTDWVAPKPGQYYVEVGSMEDRCTLNGYGRLSKP